MYLTNPLKKAIYLAAFLLISTSICGQSSWEYGLAAGLQYGDYSTKNREAQDILDDPVEAAISPYMSTYICRPIGQSSKIIAMPGFSFHQVNGNISNIKTTSLFFDLPIHYHYKILDNFAMLGGIQYRYLINLSQHQNENNISITELADNRHHTGMQLGVSYTCGSHLEVMLSAHQSLTDLYTYNITDLDGKVLDSISAKNRYLRLAFVFRK